MIKAIFWMAVGALGLYLYQDPSQMNVVVDTAKDLVNQGAEFVQDKTNAEYKGVEYGHHFRRRWDFDGHVT